MVKIVDSDMKSDPNKTHGSDFMSQSIIFQSCWDGASGYCVSGCQPVLCEA